MKIAVITRHAVPNYGSLLQAYATQTVLEQLGHSCKIIDYLRTDECGLQNERSQLLRKAAWNRNFLTRSLYLGLRQPENLLAQRKFRAEQRRLLHLTRRYSSLSQLEQDPPKADVYMTGSDQVWGSVINDALDPAYYLSFTPEDARRVSCAASLGKEQLDDARKKFFRHWLSRYACLSVREDSAVALLGQLGLSAKQMLDPTLLVPPSFWEPLLESVPKGKYILVYQLHNNPAMSRYAAAVAKEKGLPLVRISAWFHQVTRGGKFVWCPSVGQFLSYLKNAECLITDSFHGTAFALTFNVPFVEVLPNNNTSARNMSILKLTGLTCRILQDETDTALASQPLDFTQANRILAEKRKESLDILKEMLTV